MKKSPIPLTATLFGIIALAAVRANPPTTIAPPIDTPAQNLEIQASTKLSAQTQAVIAATQVLSSQAQSVLKSQLGQIPQRVVSAAQKGNADPVKHAITQQYLDTLTAVIKQFDPGSTVDQAVLGDFNFYAIVGIDRVIIDKGVAFVEAKVAYLPNNLSDIIQDEQGKVGQAEEGSLWTNAGGHAFSNTCEKGGVGRATYYLVLQGGVWKLHYVYFSLDSLTPGELKSATASMQTLIQ